MPMAKERRLMVLFIAASAIFLVTLAVFCNGTGDSGDSVMHYQYARYAFAHHNNFFNTWAKPLFVLLAAPFAQMGFAGIKIFNVVNTVIAMVTAYLIAKRLNVNDSWLVPVLLLLAPMSFGLSLSGLTEPLFAAILTAGLCCLFYDLTIPGLILLSFLPFVRSEGMFLLLPVAAYLIAQKKYAGVLWLWVGQLIYAVIGYSCFHSLLWFYMNNPYSLVSSYGSGDWIHYFLNMPIIIGPATCYLLAAGFVIIPFFLLKKREAKPNILPLWLIWIIFTIYFFFHVIAWKFGLFGSFGMVRIISAVAPLMMIIAVYGYNKTEDIITRYIKNIKGISTYCIILVLLINLVYIIIKVNGNAGAGGLDITLNADQVIETEIAICIKNKYPDYKTRPVFFNAPFLSLGLDVDPTVKDNNPMASRKEGNYPQNALYIWDDWYSVIEGGTTMESLDKDATMKRDTVISQKDRAGKLRTVALYRKI